jgi:hypothetical protein
MDGLCKNRLEMLMTLKIDAEDPSLWSMVKFFLRLAVAAMPAFYLWTFVQSLLVPFWLSLLGHVAGH